MDEEKHNRTAMLNCPTCGSTLFEYDDDIHASMPIVKCVSCEMEFNKDELIHLNKENLEQHVSEIGKAVTKDIAEEFKKTIQNALKGSKHITFK